MLGRFINLDGFVSTGTGFLGYNMFAYCENNPVNAIDSTGTDAILLQYHDAAKHMGHTGLLVQDSQYCWYYFYWGSSEGFLKTLTGSVDAFMIYTPVGYLHYGYNLSNLDDVIAALKERERVDGIWTTKLLSKVQYNLYYYNCVQVSIEALMKGKIKYNDKKTKIKITDIMLNEITPNQIFARISWEC